MRSRRSVSVASQHGYAMALILLVLTVAGSAGLLAFAASSRLALDTDRTTSKALSDAKAALVAYAVQGACFTDALNAPTVACPVPRWNWRPGALPCPDADDDGVEEATCSPGALGRIPWKTLGIPQPRDGAGETLWYAVADRFRSTSPLPINSDTPGSITVYDADGVTPLVTDAVAVVFAPGAATRRQLRSADPAPCAATGGVNPRHLCADNYLDATAGRNNAATNGPYIVGRVRDRIDAGYNDHVLHVTTRDFMPAVEMRVGAELEALLEEYANASKCQCFPWADNFSSADGVSDLQVRRGRFPIVALPEPWGLAGVPALPPWFAANNWHDVIYYTVSTLYSQGGIGRQCSNGGANDCLTGSLVVDGTAGVEALFFLPGVPRPGVVRRSVLLTAYLEDAENNDDANDLYVTPTATELNRDRIFILSGASNTQCARNARKLLKKLPCLDANSGLSASCQREVEKLLVCALPCVTAAKAMISPPCSSEPYSPQCQNHVEALRRC